MASGMKITSIETFTKDPLCIVRVRTEDGAEGYGQAAPFQADITATVLRRQIAPHVLGADSDAIEAIAERGIEANYKFPGSYICRALAGVDTALWDLRGKRQGKCVRDLLGSGKAAVAAYGSSMRRDIQPQDEGERLSKLRDAKGFGAFKVRVGKVCGHDQDQWPGRTEALIPTVRKALGDDIRLLADGNSCFGPARAIEVGRLMEQYGFSHFEEPCPYWELEWTAQVAAALDMDVAGGEQDTDLAQWARMVRMRAVDIVQPDICYVGGLTRALRVAALGAQAGLTCVPHSANLSLVSVFTVHMLAAIANAAPHMEFSVEPNEWLRELYSPFLEVKDGQVKVPDGPGWGVEIHPRWLEAAARAVSEA